MQKFGLFYDSDNSGLDSAKCARGLYIFQLECFAQEREWVMETFKNHLHLPVTVFDHSEAMLRKLKGVTDPEAKRKAIGHEFIEAFREFRDQLESKHGVSPNFLVQVCAYVAEIIIFSFPDNRCLLSVSEH